VARRRPFRRTDRLQSQIHQTLALAVQRETHEAELQAVVITGVEVTSDLSLARVFYYPMGGDPAAIAAALERAKGFLRRRVGDVIRARITPELRFLLDKSIDHGRRIEEILGGLTIAPPDPEDESDDLDEDDLDDEPFDAEAYDGFGGDDDDDEADFDEDGDDDADEGSFDEDSDDDER